MKYLYVLCLKIAPYQGPTELGQNVMMRIAVTAKCDKQYGRKS